jgi:hypothetical protein
VSIGAAVARNFIGRTAGGQDQALEVQAFTTATSISAAGALTMNALAKQTIHAGVGAGSAAIAGGGTVGVGVSGAGASTENKVRSQVRASIDGDGATGISASGIALKADDSSTITADVGAASLAVSFSGTAAVSVTIGVALARNDIANDVQAYIRNADTGVTATGGDISVKATETASITATSVAASVGVGVSLVGVAFSGAGAEGTNLINNDVAAYIENSLVSTSPTVAYTYTASQTPNELKRGDKVKVGVGTGSLVFEYLGSDRLDPNNTQPSVDLSAENYSDATLWQRLSPAHDIIVDAHSGATLDTVIGAVSVAVGVGLVGAAGSIGVSLASNLIGYDSADDSTGGGNSVKAYIQNSEIASSGAVQVNADAVDTVERTVSFAGSVAVAVGVGAVSLSGAGADATTHLGSVIKAYVSDSNVYAIGDIQVEAVSDSHIKKADAIGASLSAAVGIGGAISVAASTVTASSATMSRRICKAPARPPKLSAPATMSK